MVNKVKIFLFFFVLFNSVTAQVPGYMGKRLVVGYGLYANPGFGNLVMGYSDKAINTQHEFFIEYTTGKKFALGFSAKIYKYTYNNIDPVGATGGIISSSYYQRTENPEGSYNIKAHNYSLYGKLFKTNYLAPWGKYFSFGLCLINYEARYDPEKMYVEVVEKTYPTPTTYSVSNFGPSIQNYQKVDLFFGNGKSRIFANRIVIDCGYTINVFAMSRLFLVVLDEYGSSENEDYIKNTSTSRVAALNRFNLYFKVGYLF